MPLPEIASIGEVLVYLGKAEDGAGTEQDLAEITQIHRAAEAIVRRYVGSSIIQPVAAYTHYLPRGVNPFDLRDERKWIGERLQLPEWPVRSITSINVDRDGRFGQLSGGFPSSSALTAAEDFYEPLDATGLNRRGEVIRVNSEWYADPGSIKVIYTAGWSAAELAGNVTDPTLDASDIKLAVLKTISEIFSDTGGGLQGGGAGVATEQIGNEYRVTYVSSKMARRSLSSDVQGLLSPFRRVPVIQ